VDGERGTRRDELLLALLAAAAAFTAFLYYYHRNVILLYGDAVAHINIARRIFDSITPGPLQIGTVWLPLPHLLMIPFLISNWMWRTGVGGSIISMIACVAGTVGIYRLSIAVHSSGSWRNAGIVSAFIFAANPNLLYLQATAMTESLYLALFVWAVVFAIEWLRARDAATASKNLERCAVTVAAAMLTRYDGWFLAACMIANILAVRMVPGWNAMHDDLSVGAERLSRPAVLKFVLLLVAIAGVWFAYNYREFGNPSEFATGPYSARAIERRASDSYNQHHPGYHSPVVAAEYFLKSAKLNVGSGGWELPLTIFAAIGLLAAIVTRAYLPAILLSIPVPFYALSIAYGGVPIFLPIWWPFSYYNARYGLELLPAISVFTGVAVATAFQYLASRVLRLALLAAVLAIVIASYLSVWRAVPICLREAHANGDDRQKFEIALAHELQKLPRSSRLLMSTGEHPGALERAGFPLRQVINESNHPQWEQALAAPARTADYIVTLDNDDVAQAVAAHPADLIPQVTVTMPGDPRTTIYKSLQRSAR